ncbi:MAG: Protein translocase subunit SecE [Candidatus Anoxychlamydiales bacterium]|nr:Protein translocase subunit SecE [Candidatus Anoxychlamydiales bacterium]
MTTSSKITHLKVKKKKLNYFRDVQSELKKITWTSKAELISCTKIVLGVTIFFSLAIYVGDLFIKNALHLINLISKLVFG